MIMIYPLICVNTLLVSGRDLCNTYIYSYLHTSLRSYVRTTERSLASRIRRVAESDGVVMSVCVFPSAPHGTSSLLLDGFL